MSELFAASGVSLTEVLDVAHCLGSRPPRVTSCTDEWAYVKPGDAYVAVTRAETDGHNWATRAAERGAAVIVCERQLPVFHVPQVVVEDSVAAYGSLCQALVGNPCRDLQVIGVTGVAGKSTVVTLLASVINAAGGRTGTIGTLGCWDGFELATGWDGSMPAPLLAKKLAQMVVGGCTHAAVELSAPGLAASSHAGLSLDAVCINNAGCKHPRHKSPNRIRCSTARILDSLNATGVAVLNADDPGCCHMLSELGQPALTFGMRQPAEVTAELVEQYMGEQMFVLSAGGESVGVRTSIVGQQHVYNCLAAATLGLVYGIDLTTIAHGLEAVVSIPGRMERIECGQGFAVILDSADSACKLGACLRTVRSVTAGRVICVFSPPPAQRRQQQQQLHTSLDRFADLWLVTGDANADPKLRSATRGVSRIDAIVWALDQARQGDSVVIAGDGQHCGDAITDERQLVRQLLIETDVAMPVGSTAA